MLLAAFSFVALSLQGGPPPAGGPLPALNVPAGNPITPAKALLGQALFWEEQLSATGTTACATCHIPAAGSSDPRSVPGDTLSVAPGFDGLFGTGDDVVGSRGVPASDALGFYDFDAQFGFREQVTPRKSPPVINAAFFDSLFWDGRADDVFSDPETGAVLLPAFAALETQAAGPPLSSVEMGHSTSDWTALALELEQATPLALAEDLPPPLANFVASQSYPDLFEVAFGDSDVTPARILMAIATYERTLIADQSPADLFFGGDSGALSPSEQAGLAVFNGPGRCNLCHSGALFSDGVFHNVGLRPAFEDQGRFAISGNPLGLGAFKTPALRNVELRAPYFHNGSMATLEDVIDFYDRGGDFHLTQSPTIQPLNLTQTQKNDLAAFLRSLTDPRVAAELPPFDRPTLFTESARASQTFGNASPTSAGLLPTLFAIEPAFLGNPSWTLALTAAPNALGIFAIDPVASTGIDILGAAAFIGFSPALILIPTPLDTAGNSSLPLLLPPDPSAAGTYTLQAFSLELGTPLHLGASKARAVSLF